MLIFLVLGTLLAVALSRASVAHVEYKLCDSMLGSSGPCGDYFGGWPVRFVRYSPPPGVESDPNVSVELSELRDTGYAPSSFLTNYFVANCILWAIPVNLAAISLALFCLSVSPSLRAWRWRGRGS